MGGAYVDRGIDLEGLGCPMRRGGPFWYWVWNRVESPWTGYFFPRRMVPWLFGMMISAKGRREDQAVQQVEPHETPDPYLRDTPMT